jgi:hypothetical protein
MIMMIMTIIMLCFLSPLARLINVNIITLKVSTGLRGEPTANVSSCQQLSATVSSCV